MDSITTKGDYNGVAQPVPAANVHTSGEYNDRNVELEGSVTDSGQSLASADTGQLSKAMFANGVAAQSMNAGGGVNDIELTPVTGASGLRVATPSTPDYSLLDGAIFNFKATGTNTGNMTVNVGRSVGTLIGAQPLFLVDGTTNLKANAVQSGGYYTVRYDSTLDVDGAFVLLEAIVPYTGQESVSYPDGKIEKTGTISVTTSTNVVFAVPFPNAIKIVLANPLNPVAVNITIQNKTVTGFTLTEDGAGSMPFDWLAIGR